MSSNVIAPPVSGGRVRTLRPGCGHENIKKTTGTTLLERRAIIARRSQPPARTANTTVLVSGYHSSAWLGKRKQRTSGLGPRTLDFETETALTTSSQMRTRDLQAPNAEVPGLWRAARSCWLRELPNYAAVPDGKRVCDGAASRIGRCCLITVCDALRRRTRGRARKNWLLLRNMIAGTAAVSTRCQSQRQTNDGQNQRPRAQEEHV